MSDTPNPSEGEVPPMPGEAPKVQPKKDTVRISLPPKPKSSATIKLPSLPGGAKPPGAAPAAAPPGAGAPPAKPAGVPPVAPKPPSGASPAAPGLAKPGAPASATATTAPATRPPAAAPAARRPASSATQSASPMDTALAVMAGLLGVGALISLLLLLTLK